MSRNATKPAKTTSGVLGYVAVGRGDFPLARAYCLEAFQLGDFAENSDLQAWARGMHSFCEYYAGQYDEALRLFECYSAAQTASNAATAYVALGMPEKVQHYVSLAMPDISASGSAWSRSLVMMDLALSLIRAQDADLDHAASLVLDALGISAGRPIISVQQRAAEFIRETTGRWGDVRQISPVRDAVLSAKVS